jgi:GntR family transcriptional regulator
MNISNKTKLSFILDKTSKVPYYHQIYLSISQKIDSNIIKDGEKLPNELDICKDFGISRITVRQAFKELETKGYVFRERGRGTFVRKKIEAHALERFSSIVDELKKAGVEIKGKIIENIVINPDKSIREILKADATEKILFVKRVVYADGSPLYVTKLYIPYGATGLISKKILTSKSFMEIITKIYNIKILHMKSVLEPIIPDKEIAELLSLHEKKKKIVQYMQTFWTMASVNRANIIYFQDYLNPSKGKFVFEKNFK